jgi:ATP-dependent helicase HrpA
LAVAKPRVISDLSQLSAVIRDTPKPANPWAIELEALVPRRFLETTSFAQLSHLPRYLKALATRIERAALNPTKDKERAQQIAPYLAALKTFADKPPRSPEGQQALEMFRWMVEEFKVSLFAQELGTAIPVSPTRLNQQWEKVKS